MFALLMAISNTGVVVGISGNPSKPTMWRADNVPVDLNTLAPDAPLLISLARRGFRLVEVPVHMRERHAGRSFYTLGRSLYYPYKNLLASLMAMLQRP